MNATHGPINLAQRYAEGCPDHRYIIRFLSEDPLMMYVQNLLSKEEADHFLDLAEPFYKPSAVVGTKGKTYDPEFRKSVSARVPEDAVIKCIRKRVADFQGFISVDRVEDIHVVKYGKDDHIRFHFDGHEGLLNPRLSTFFVYVACDDKLNGGTCEGGETGFPNWPGSFAREWCDLGLVDCAQSEKGGIYFRPIVGNAIFWHNIYPNGTEVEGTYHGGMPVTKGRKAGLNIWSRKYGISKEILRVNDRNQLSEKDRAKCDAASKDGPCYVEVV
jgi:prolyl 4-hydroxylase